MKTRLLAEFIHEKILKTNDFSKKSILNWLNVYTNKHEPIVKYVYWVGDDLFSSREPLFDYDLASSHEAFNEDWFYNGETNVAWVFSDIKIICEEV